MGANSFAQKLKATSHQFQQGPHFSQAAYEKIMAQAKKDAGSRGVAEVDAFDYASGVPEDFKNLTAELVGGNRWQGGVETAIKEKGVQDGPALATLISNYEKIYSTLSPSSKLVVAQLIALKPFRAITYRMRTILERDHTPMVHGMIISFIRGINASVNNIFPSQQWKAGFAYLTQPYVGVPGQIGDEVQLRNLIAGDVSTAFVELYNRINEIPTNSPLAIDNRIFWGKANFASDKDRFVLYGNAEKNTQLSGISFAVSGLYFMVAYNWFDMFRTAQDLGTVYGFSTVASPDSMTAKRRVHEIEKNDSLFKLVPGEETWTRKGGSKGLDAEDGNGAYDWFIAGLRHAKASWAFTKGLQDKGDYHQTTLLDPRGFLPFVRVINTSFTNVDDIILGKPVLSSMVAGDVVRINFRSFFNTPPGDLKKFLPNDFESDLFVDKEKIEPKSHLPYRNYDLGNPKGWLADRVAIYRNYFPSVNNSEDVKKTARILNQTWGGTPFGIAMSFMMF